MLENRCSIPFMAVEQDIKADLSTWPNSVPRLLLGWKEQPLFELRERDSDDSNSGIDKIEAGGPTPL